MDGRVGDCGYIIFRTCRAPPSGGPRSYILLHDDIIVYTCTSVGTSGSGSCPCGRCTCSLRRSCGRWSSSARVAGDVARWPATRALWSPGTPWTRRVPTPSAACARPAAWCSSRCPRCTSCGCRRFPPNNSLRRKRSTDLIRRRRIMFSKHICVCFPGGAREK